jgi:Tfp pilus assembly protein PilX
MNGLKLYHGRYVACRSGVTAGAALILTLACIVILTALVLLFLTHSLLETQVSVASADQTAASLFARGAVDSVIGELKQEIAAGSATPFVPAGSDLRDPNTVFLPTTNQTMVPYRMDSGAPANVLKRSSYNEPFYAGTFYNTTTWPAPQWAVNVSSTNPGTGSRYVSMQRWNEPLLMPTASSTNTDLTPASGFIPPDWVYVSRTAGPATTWSTALIPNTVSSTLNTNCVVGRYAYVVYDEGGLLDANAAGYPSTALDGTPITSVMMRHKISEACADLTQIGLTNSDINALVAWRNPANGATATQYTNYVYSMSTNAFLTPAINGSTTERLFTSRQQLIDFLTQNVAANKPSDVERMQGALPYLTTFSRELNAPSWYPQTNMAAGAYKYFTIATNAPASATNAFALIERANSIYTNSSGLVCNNNQPVAFSRFPLSRLSWIGSSGPTNGATAPQVQQSFGLIWDSSNSGTNCAWQYVGSALPLASDTTVQGSVETLAQVRAEATPREPNFFEILKAAILSGSVNLTPLEIGGTSPSFSRIDSRYSQADQQIMQIGLYAIDQASPTLLPTRVEFGNNISGDWNSALYGSKNIPYIYKFVFTPYRPTTEQITGTNYTMFHAWSEPVLWSPYQNAPTNTSPLQIRIRADGTNSGLLPGEIGATTVESLDPTAVPATQISAQCLPEVDCGPAGSDTGMQGANGSSFEVDSTSAAAIVNDTLNPVLLASLVNTPGIGYVINDKRAGPPGWGTGPTPPPWTPSAANTTNADVYTENGITYAGFWLGRGYAPNPPVSAQTNYQGQPATYGQAYFYSGEGSGQGRGNHSYVLEANYGSAGTTNFLEIQRMDHQYSSGAGVEENDYFTSQQRRLDFYTFNDPRTGRFGFDQMQPSSYSATGANSPVSANDSLAVTLTTYESNTNNYFAGGFLRNILQTTPSITFLYTGSTPGGGTSDNFRFADNTGNGSSSGLPAYQDADGAQRQGDGWWFASTANAMPMREDTPQDRPVFLGRPFYSVGELGYVSRDMPWRSLNFSSTNSPDAGLLDYFCINDGYAGSTNSPVVAGVLDLNTRNPQVLQAMLSGADRAQLYPGTTNSSPVGYDMTAIDATNIATTITGITASLPLLSKSELATRIAPNDPTVISRPATKTQALFDTNIKERREAVVRALASAGQVRTWNVMIDVVAQTGHLPPGATGFNNFVVTAEQRYWAHVAIDRYTGQVVSMQLEPVSE